MANENEYLNEERYQNAKKKIKKVSLATAIISIILGGALIAFGIITTKNAESEAEKINKERYEAVARESQVKMDEINAQKATLEEQLKAKEYECDSIWDSIEDSVANFKSINQSADLNACRDEVSSIQKQIQDLNSKAFQLKGNTIIANSNKVVAENYYPLAFVGGMILVMGIAVSVSIYSIAIRREINAFHIQQNLPLAQEGIDKMAPTIGGAAGEIAKGVANGIKSGLDDNQKE